MENCSKNIATFRVPNFFRVFQWEREKNQQDVLQKIKRKKYCENLRVVNTGIVKNPSILHIFMINRNLTTYSEVIYDKGFFFFTLESLLLNFIYVYLRLFPQSHIILEFCICYCPREREGSFGVKEEQLQNALCLQVLGKG